MAPSKWQDPRLYTMIDMENNSNVNIATLEDLIEMQINFVNQSQNNPDFWTRLE